jgi:hypothetical protein
VGGVRLGLRHLVEGVVGLVICFMI